MKMATVRPSIITRIMVPDSYRLQAVLSDTSNIPQMILTRIKASLILSVYTPLFESDQMCYRQLRGYWGHTSRGRNSLQVEGGEYQTLIEPARLQKEFRPFLILQVDVGFHKGIFSIA